MTVHSTPPWCRSSSSSTSSSLCGSSLTELELSAVQSARLERMADAVLRDTLEDYRVHRELQQRRVAPEQWKEVRRLANLVTYRERPRWRKLDNQLQLLRSMDGGGIRSVVNSSPSSSSSPSVLVVGGLQGSLDDEMYGAFVGGDKGARLRSSYLDDGLQDFQWLATLRSPTAEDPFRCCGVARAVLGRTSRVGRLVPFATKCELCVVLSMGVTATDAGERVGYYVMHSVDLGNVLQSTKDSSSSESENRPRPSRFRGEPLARATTSMCWLKCELHDVNQRVELFAHGFLASANATGGTNGLALRAAISLAQTSDTAYAKKLHWMMHDAMGRSRRLSVAQDRCVNQCRPTFGAKALGRCVICRSMMCRACRVDRKITVDMSSGGAHQLRCGLCVNCMTRAKRSPAAAFVAREAGRRQLDALTSECG